MKKNIWQSIEMLPVVAGRIEETIVAVNNQLETLEAHQPYGLENATLERLMETYQQKMEHLLFLKEQTHHWHQTDYLTERQKEMLAALEQSMGVAEKIIQSILQRVQYFLQGTLDSFSVEENRAWMKRILAGNTAVPESFKEELTKMKVTADTLSLFQQETMLTLHEHMCTLQVTGASEADTLHLLRDYLPTLKTLRTPEKHDALVYYCCLYPGLNKAMQLLDEHENEISDVVITL